MSVPPQGAVTGAAAQVGHSTFSALVLDDTDLVGHVAYALYKRDKLKFCQVEAARTGAPVSAASVDSFIRVSNLDTRIEAYRDEAEKLLEQMTEYVLEDAIKEVKKEHTEQLVRKLSEGKSWKRAIAENFFGSVVVAMVWAVIVFAVSANKVGVERVLGDAFGKEISDRQAPPAKPAASVPGLGSPR